MDQDKTSQVRVTAVTLVATLGGLLFGYDTAVISGAVGAIDANFVDPWQLSPTARDSLSGFAISSALVGTIIGAAMAGWASTRFGRRASMQLAAILFFVSALGSALPELGFAAVGEMGREAVRPFIFYRILGGIGVGLASMLAPMYIAEIAPSRIRGRLVSYNQMAIIFGMLVVYFVNWGIALQGDDAWVIETGWRWMFASECIPAALFFVLLLRVPESPRWLVLKDRNEAALAVLGRFNAPDRARQVLDEIKVSLAAKSEPLFKYGGVLIAVGILLSVFQQFVGINVVLYYAPFIFQNMGATTDTALLQTVLVGAANLAFTLVAILTVDRLGRRPLMITGALVMAAAMFTLGSLFNANALGLPALIAMLVYIAGFAMSWGPVTWVLLSEIFPNPIKGKAMAIAVVAQWVANLAVSWSFKVIDGNSWLVAQFNHGFAYWIYGVMGVLAALFVLRVVPETKGRHLEDMHHLWARA